MRFAARVGAMRRLFATLVLTGGTIATTGCWWIQAAEERSYCDDAIGKICDTDGIDCSKNPPRAVEVLRRCEGDEFRNDEYGNLPLCINDSATYTKIIAALAKSDVSLCTLSCNRDTACDVEQACHEFQHASCSLATADGGAPDA